MKHYMDIQRLKQSNSDGFSKGDKIQITEKIDGANFSIKYNADTDEIEAFSRKNQLSFANNLRGAWNFAQTLNKEAIRSVLGNNLILFGEWLVKHSVVYPNDAYNKAYFYDVWDCENECYLTQGKVKEIVQSLGLIYAPVFYEGEFISWEHIHSFVGRTDLGGEYGEGVVVKNQARMVDPSTRTDFYVKIVGEKFAERKASKDRSRQVDPDKIAERELAYERVGTVVTEARIRKLLHKFVDEAIIPEDWDEKNMRDVAKNLPKRVYEDCVKEESDVVNEVGAEFGKIAAKICMAITRQILEERLMVK